MTIIRIKRGTLPNIGTLVQGEPFYATDDGGLFIGDGVSNPRCTMDADEDLTSKSWFLDEDDFNSNDATKVASQQSIKAYSDVMQKRAFLLSYILS
jgi:hypothetical protein